MRDLRLLPKAHLHVHLDAIARRETIDELAARAGIAVPRPRGFGSFAAFSDTITAAQRCLLREEDLARVVGEAIEDAAAQGVRWLELSMWPGLAGGRFGGDADVVRLVIAAGTQAADRHGIGFGVMVAANRDAGPDAAATLARVAAPFAGEGVVSFGLDGDESGSPGRLFAEAFDIARAAGLLATPHAGELSGADSVADALDVLGARRVLHGVRAIDDALLLRRLRDSDVCLDVCPTSNVLLGVVPSIDAHPLPALLAAGVACSVNADDPLLFDCTILREYELCRKEFGLDDAAIAAIARNSLTSSGAPRELVETSLTAIDQWLATP